MEHCGGRPTDHRSIHTQGFSLLSKLYFITDQLANIWNLHLHPNAYRTDLVRPSRDYKARLFRTPPFLPLILSSLQHTIGRLDLWEVQVTCVEMQNTLNMLSLQPRLPPKIHLELWYMQMLQNRSCSTTDGPYGPEKYADLLPVPLRTVSWSRMVLSAITLISLLIYTFVSLDRLISFLISSHPS